MKKAMAMEEALNLHTELWERLAEIARKLRFLQSEIAVVASLAANVTHVSDESLELSKKLAVLMNRE